MVWYLFSWRCLSLVTLDALTPASVHSLWSSPKCLNRFCLTVFSSLLSSLLLVRIFLPNYFLPVNFAFNMLWYSTPWTAPPPPFSNDPLWVTLFVESVNDCLLDHCQVSSLPRDCGFKEQEIPGIYTVWMVGVAWYTDVTVLYNFGTIGTKKKSTIYTILVEYIIYYTTWELAHGLKRATFAVLLLALAVIKQRCNTAGAPLWIGGELPEFVVRSHAPNLEVRTVTVRYEYRATPNEWSFIEIQM